MANLKFNSGPAKRRTTKVSRVKTKNLAQELKRKAVKQSIIKTLSKYDAVIEEQIFNRIMDTKRQFRADYYCPNLKLIIELNGGQWVNGRHNRGGEAYEGDLTKINLAQMNGYHIWQYTYEMIQRGQLRKDLEQWMKLKQK